MDKKVGKRMWFKGIIMEVKDDYSIVMKDDSTVVRVKNKGQMKKGDVNIFLEEDIYEKKESKNTNNKMIVSILSIAAVLTLLVIPVMQNALTKSYALVSLDVNPSIQFELDENKKIVDIYGLNEDGKKLHLKEIKGLTLDEGIKKLKADLESNKYNLKNDSAIVGFAFLTDKESNIYEDEVKNIISKEFEGTKTAFLKGSKEDSKLAKDKGLSLGRYEAKLSMDEDIMEEQIEKMSVEEILSLLSNKENIYLNEEMKEELQDELEDKIEDKIENENNDEYEEDSNDDNDNVKPYINYQNNQNDKVNNSNNDDDNDDDDDTDDDDYDNDDDDD